MHVTLNEKLKCRSCLPHFNAYIWNSTVLFGLVSNPNVFIAVHNVPFQTDKCNITYQNTSYIETLHFLTLNALIVYVKRNIKTLFHAVLFLAISPQVRIDLD